MPEHKCDSNCPQVGVLETSIKFLHEDVKEIKESLPPLSELVQDHKTKISLLERDKKWVLIIVGFVGSLLGLAIDYLKK